MQFVPFAGRQRAQEAADAWHASTGGRGAVIHIDISDFKGMMEKLYGSIPPLIEDPPEANLSVASDDEPVLLIW